MSRPSLGLKHQDRATIAVLAVFNVASPKDTCHYWALFHHSDLSWLAITVKSATFVYSKNVISVIRSVRLFPRARMATGLIDQATFNALRKHSCSSLIHNPFHPN